MRFAILAGALVALALAAPALAHHCSNWSTYQTAVGTCAVSASSCYYVAVDPCPPHCGLTTFWVYEETNGIPGLQRADSNVNNTCHGMVRSDHLIY